MTEFPFTQDMAASGWYLLKPDTAKPGVGMEMFQVLGERASGTNYIRRILELNTELRSSGALGWKHGFPSMVALPANLLVICAIRDAEAWALSMHKRPWHANRALQGLPFSEFIRSPWHSVVDRTGHFDTLHADLAPLARGKPLQLDRHPITGAPFENLFALRRAKLAALMGMLNRGGAVALVRMETVTEASESFVNRLCKAVGAPTPQQAFRTPKRRMGTNFRRASVSRPDTPDAMNTDDRAFMRAHLDLPLEAALGYHYG